MKYVIACSLFCLSLYIGACTSLEEKQETLTISGELMQQRWPNHSSYSDWQCARDHTGFSVLFAFLQDLPLLQKQDSIIIMGVTNPCREDSFRLHLFYMIPGEDGDSKTGSLVLSTTPFKSKEEKTISLIRKDTLQIPGWIYAKSHPQRSNVRFYSFIHLPNGISSPRTEDDLIDSFFRKSTYPNYFIEDETEGKSLMKPQYDYYDYFSHLPWHLQFDFFTSIDWPKLDSFTYDTVLVKHYPDELARYRESILSHHAKRGQPNYTYYRLHDFIWSHSPCIGMDDYWNLSEMGYGPPKVFVFAKAGKQLRLSMRDRPENPESAGFYAWYNRLAKAFGICKFEDW